MSAIQNVVVFGTITAVAWVLHRHRWIEEEADLLGFVLSDDGFEPCVRCSGGFFNVFSHMVRKNPSALAIWLTFVTGPTHQEQYLERSQLLLLGLLKLDCSFQTVRVEFVSECNP